MAEKNSDQEQKPGKWRENAKEIGKAVGVLAGAAGVCAALFHYAPNNNTEQARVAAQEKPPIDRAQREQAIKDQLTLDGFPAIDKVSFGQELAASGPNQVSVDIGIGACILRNVSAVAEIDATGGVSDMHNYRFSFTTEPAVAYPFENADNLPGVFHDQDPCKVILDHTPIAVLR